MGEVGQKKSKFSSSDMRVPKSSSQKSSADLGRCMSRLKVRRNSYGFQGVPGIKPMNNLSNVGFEYKRPSLLYLPTYQLEPHQLFNVERVTNLVEGMITENFTGHKYNGLESPALAIRLAGEIMREVKAMQFNRYRIISVVTIGQKRSQSFNNTVSFIWDRERDNYVETHRENSTAFLQVMVFAVYLD